MPPRIPLFQCLKTPQLSVLPRTTSIAPQSTRNASTATQRKRHRDPYAIAQAKARKAANLSRQKVLQTERAASLGDPVRGRETPFVQSFDYTSPPPTEQDSSKSSSSSSTTQEPAAQPLNFLLREGEVSASLAHSERLTTIPERAREQDLVDDFTNPDHSRRRDEHLATIAAERDTAHEALRRISALALGNTKDRLRANMARCIDTFGRHRTDATLPPKPSSPQQNAAGSVDNKNAEPFPRVGPDTGSSEVQIAILTAKIRTLAEFLATRGPTDKVNKRNLRLLVHRRQKLLKYLRRKERGGPRWQHVVDTLGLTEATWKGEISL